MLIVVENLPVPLDRRVWQEACALRDAGYRVSVICPRMRGYNEPYEELEGIRIHRHWISSEAGGLVGFLAEYASALWGETVLAWRIWRKDRFQVIHLCNPPDLLFLVALPFRWMGARVVYDLHDVWPEMFEAKFQRRGLLYQMVKWCERLTFATAHVAIATNESVRDFGLQRGGKKPEEIFVVRTSPKAIDTSVPANPELKKGKKYLVGYIGVMGDSDGLEYLLRAIAHIVHEEKREDVRFLLMGTGPDYDRLLGLRTELGLENSVEMPGRVSDHFLSQALQTMDLGVSCDPINDYNQHCTMNKVLEYMAFGKAQVMFELKEGRYSAGDAAVYVDANDPVKYARAVLDLLDDPEKRERLGRLGRERLQKELNWERSTENLLAAYRRALGSELDRDEEPPETASKPNP